MKNPEIILVGGGGHCKACIDVIETEDKYQIIGIIDIPEKLGEEILGYKIIGNDDEIPQFIEKETYFLITLGHLGNPKLRIKLFELIQNNGGKFATVISPLAHISKHSIIGEGTIVMHHVIVNANAKVGKNCIINNKALIEHDTIINDDVHISTGAIINGTCEIGESCFIGSQSIINHIVKINSNIIIGSGSVVRKNLIEEGLYVGNPVKKIR